MFGKRSSSERAPAGSAALSVLLAGDGLEHLRAVRVALAAQGCRLEIAETAGTAVLKLQSFRPECILVDPKLPGTDGRPLGQHLLADRDLMAVPLIALAGAPAEAGQPSIPDALFDGSITGEADMGTLAAMLRETIARCMPVANSRDSARAHTETNTGPGIAGRAAGILQSIDAGYPESQFAATTSAWLDQLIEAQPALGGGSFGRYLRLARRLAEAGTARGRQSFRWLIRLCRDRLDGDPETTPAFEDLRSGYITHRAEELGRLADALDDGEWETLSKAGHNLKGTGAAYGFAELTELGRNLEKAAKAADRRAAEALVESIGLYLGMVGPAPGEQ